MRALSSGFILFNIWTCIERYRFELCYNIALRRGLCYSHAAPFKLDSTVKMHAWEVIELCSSAREVAGSELRQKCDLPVGRVEYKNQGEGGSRIEGTTGL